MVLKVLIASVLLISSNATLAAHTAALALSRIMTDAHRYSAGLGSGLTVDWASTECGIREFDPLAVHDIKQRGFGHMAIHVSGAATPQRLLHLRKIVQACARYDLVLMLIWEGPAKELLAMTLTHYWSQVARYFNSQYPALGFMLLAPGESDTRSASALNTLYYPAIKAIHQIDPQRIIIVAPHLHGTPEMLAQFRLPANNPQLLVSWRLSGNGPQQLNGRTPWAKGSAAEKMPCERVFTLPFAGSKKPAMPPWSGLTRR